MLQCHSCTLPGIRERLCCIEKEQSKHLWGLKRASKFFGSPTVLRLHTTPLSLTLSMCTVQCEHFTRQDGVDVGVPSFPTSSRQPLSVQNPVKRAWNQIFPFCLQWTFHFRLGPQPTIKVDSRSCNSICKDFWSGWQGFNSWLSESATETLSPFGQGTFANFRDHFFYNWVGCTPQSQTWPWKETKK